MNFPVVQRTSLSPPFSLRFSWRFLWVPCSRTESTNLSALFFLLFLSLQKESEEPFRLCFWPFGAFLLSIVHPSLLGTVCVCVHVCAHDLAHVDSLFFLKAVCVHAPRLRAPADTPGAQCENVCASMVHIPCGMCALPLYSV